MAKQISDWTVEDLKRKGEMVEECLSVFGVTAARQLSAELGFPVPPVELVDRGRQFSLVLVPQGGLED